jgi:hypothetical protein
MYFPQVHASTGLVCLADPTTAAPTSPCPSSAPVFDGPVGQEIRIGVYISGSENLTAFDVTLRANSTVLRPVDIDLTGSILEGPQSKNQPPIVVVECLLGILVKGSTCSRTDTVDSIHLVAAEALGSTDAPAPATGLLFTAIYNITGASPNLGISMGFQTGCSSTSVSPNVCVSISNGEGVLQVETVQTGVFFNNFNSASMAFVAVSANQTSFGPEFPGTSNGALITATAKNGYPNGAPDAVMFTSTASPGLTASIIGVNPCSTGGASCSVTVSLSAASAGTYSVTFYGTYASIDPSSHPDTLVGTVTLTVVVNDFGFAISPTTVSFISGEIGIATATLTSLNGFAGTATLSIGVVSPGLTIDFSPNPVVLTSGGTVTSRITYKASPAVATTYHATIKATVGTRAKTSTFLTISVSAPVPDFYLIATPDSIGPVDAGVSSTSTITMTYVNGFAGSVALSLSGPSALNAALNQTSVTATHNATLTVSASLASNYSVLVSGSSGSTTHSVTINVVVVDFNFTAGPNNLSFGQGAFGISDIHVAGVNGFSQTVSLSDVASPGLSVTLSKSAITGSGDSVLNVTAPATMAPGRYNVNVTGLSSPLQHVVQVNVTVLKNDFSMLAVPGMVSSKPNVNTNSTITVSSLNDFVGTVTLTVAAPSGVTATLNVTSVSVPKNRSAAAFLTLSATSTGTFLVNVTGVGGVGGSLNHKVGLTFTVSLKDFTIAASQTSLTLESRAPGVSLITVTALGGFAGNVTFIVTGQTGITATMSLKSVLGSGNAVLTVNATLAGNYTVTVSGVSGSLSHDAVVTVKVVDFALSASPNPVPTIVGQRGNSTISITAINHFSGTVSISSNSASCSLNVTSVTGSGSARLSCLFSASGSYSVLVTASDKPTGSLSYSKTITINVGDFGVSNSIQTLTIYEGASATFQATVSAENGFSGPVTLVGGVIKPGGSFSGGLPTVSFSQSTVTLTPSGSATVTVTVNVGTDVLPFPFGISVNATSAGLLRSAAAVGLTVPVPTFSIASSSSSVVAGPGVSGSGTVILASKGGLSGQVNLTVSVPTGLQCSLSLSNLRLHVDGSNTTVLTCAGPIGSYTVTISGVGLRPSGVATTGQGTVGFVVADFSLSTIPNAIPNLSVDQSAHAQISITWSNSFNGNVNLTLTSDAGLTASLNSPTVSGSGTATLTVSSHASGTYNVKITGTSGGSSHSVQVSVTVVPVQNAPSIFGVDATVFYSVIGVVVVAVIGGVVVLMRRRSK